MPEPELTYYPIRYVINSRHFKIDITNEVSADPRCLWSEAHFCQSCGRIWARIYGLKDWTIRVHPCPDCGGGSLIDWNSADYYIQNLPIELLQYEVMIWQSPT